MHVRRRYSRNMATAAFGIPVEMMTRDDHVEVRGLEESDLLTAIELLGMLKNLEADQASQKREQLITVLMASQPAQVPPESLEQSRRVAALRDRLLATPHHTYESLWRLRQESGTSATRTRVSRERNHDKLFTVRHLGRTYIPAFQLDPAGGTRDDLRPLLEVLLRAGIDEWQLWTWLTTPSPFLSGEIPAEVARENPDRALMAVRRFADRTSA